MSKLLDEVKKDTLLMLSVGEYSDYHAEGIFKVLADFDINKIAKEIRSQHADRFLIDSELLTKRLVDLNLVEPVKCREIHTGYYSMKLEDYGEVNE